MDPLDQDIAALPDKAPAGPAQPQGGSFDMEQPSPEAREEQEDVEQEDDEAQPAASAGPPPLPTSTPVREPGGAEAPIQAASPQPGSLDADIASLPDKEPPAAEQLQALVGLADHGDKHAAEVIRYSAASGLDPYLVDANLEDLKKRVEASGVSWDDMAKKTPALARFMVENPHAAPMIQKDAHNLGMLEAALSLTWYPFVDALKQQETTGLQFLRAEGVKGLDTTIQMRLLDEQQEAQRYGPDYGAHNFLTRGIVSTAKFLPYYLGDLAARYGGGVLGGLFGAGAGSETGPGAVGTGLGGAALGQFAASSLFNYAETLGPLSWELDHYRDKNGQPLNPHVANLAAQMASAGTGLLMGGGLSLLGKTGAGEAAQGMLQKAMPSFIARASQRLAGSALVRWLEDDAVRSTISRFVGRLGLHVATGAVMTAGQQGANAAALEAAKGASGLDTDWSNVGDAMVQGAMSGLRDLWLFSAVAPVRDALKDAGRARLSAQNLARFQAATEAAKASTTLDASPEAFRKVVDFTAPAAKVYVPAERWVSYFQGQKLDPEQKAREVGVEPEKLQDAISRGGDIEVKASDFLAGLAKDGHADGLVQDIKMSPDDETARDRAARTVRQNEELVQAQEKKATELEAGKKRIVQYFLDMAKVSKFKRAEWEGVRSGAPLLAEAVATRAARMNVSMQEAARDLGNLTLTGKEGITSEHRKIQQAFNEWLAPSGSTLSREAFESMSPENQARSYYMDSNVNLPNEEHFKELAEHEAAQSFGEEPERQFAHVSVEGNKFVNDNLDHGKGDLLYRAAAKALHEASPAESGLAKTGGDFELRVKDQAELDDILRKANEAMPPELKGFELTGRAGASRDEAKKAHIAFKDEAEAAGTRAKRGEKPFGFKGDLATLKFPEEMAKGEVHPEIAKAFDALSKEERFTKAVVGAHGVLTSVGWNLIPRKRWVAALDLKKLKLTNETLGKPAGDALIDLMKQVASHHGGSSFDFAHLHGDEFAAQADDPAALRRFIDTVHEKAKDVGLKVTWPEGPPDLFHLEFRHGIGRGSYEAADQELNRRKKLEPGSGDGAGGGPEARTDRSGRAPGEGETSGAAEGGSHPSWEARGLEAGSESRGAAPQGYPGAEFRRRLLNQEAVARQAEPEPPQVVKEAQAAIERMRNPERKAQFQAVLDHATGKTDRRPPGIPDAVIGEMADRWGIAHPDDEAMLGARDTSKTGGYRGPKKSGGLDSMPEELRRYREDNIALRERRFNEFDQGPLAYVEGRPITFNAEGRDDKGNPRGQIQFDPANTGHPRAFNIQILSGDRSTFMHESAHFLGMSLHDLATSDLATPQIKADYDTLLQWMGYESPEQRMKEIGEGSSVAKEERLSHGFEAYLQEGRAPSNALARVFSRFKDWLLRIYRGADGVAQQYRDRYGEELKLSDDVRQVFDRLLAQDEALKQASDAVGGTDGFEEALKGMSPEEAARWRELLRDAKARAEQVTASGGDERQKALDAQRSKFKSETIAELDAQPVYRAWHYLEFGYLPDREAALAPTDENGRPFKLAKGDLIREYGEDVAKRMPPDSLRARGGIPADQLAPVLGFSSGDDLVNALKAATPRTEAIEQGTQARMDAAYGPQLERDTEQALSGVHNGKDMEAAVLELRGLAKQVNPEVARRARSVDTELLRRNVDRMTGQKYVDQLDPATYARTERKLALEARELWGKGEKEAAYDKMEQRLVNKLLFMSERDAKDELDKAKRRIEKPSEAVRADLGKADPAYRDVHDSLLAAVGLGPKPQGEGLKGLDDLLQVADRDGQDVGPWTDLARQLLAQPQAWEGGLTVDQARTVVDAVKNIRHMADEALNVTLLGKKQQLDELRTAIANRVATVQPAVKRPAYGGKESSLLEKAEMKRRGLSAILQDVETISEMMDGGTQGPVHDLLVNSRLEARDREVELIKETLQPLKEAFEKIPKDIRKLRDQSADVAHLLPPPPGREAGYTRSFLWSLFLNMGNEGNLQRLRDGNGWDMESMRRAVSLLTPAELDFLQGVRDVADGLYPKLAEAYERRTGLKLGKVEASPVIINGKEYRGGYWPIRYDRDAEGNQGLKQEINDIKDLLPTNLTPSVTNSATKARVESVKAPLDLTWSTVPSHFATVIHDIAYGDWVRQVAKVMVKPRVPNPDVPSFNKVATDYLGPERTAELLPWLRDVATSRADSNAGHVAQAIRDTGWLRSRLTAAAIMLNMPSTIRHLFDPYTTMADSEAVLPNYIAHSYLKVMNPASWRGTPEFALSKELEYRRATHDDNLRNELNRMGKVTGLMQRATEVGFALHKWVDMFTTRVAFKAAYDQAIANGATQEQAVQRADDVVRRSFPSGDIAEKPPILRTRQGWAAVVTFYGYAAKMHNLRSREFDRLYRSWNADKTLDLDQEAPDQAVRARAVAETAAKMIGLGLVSAMGAYFAGRGPTQKEDDEKGLAKSRAEWLATETLLSPMDDAPPLVGPALKAALLGHKTDIATAPELSVLDSQFKRLGDLIHGKKQEDEGEAWNLAAMLIGALGPLGQAQRTVPYLKDAATGKQRPRGPLDAAAGVLYGDKKTAGANPLTDAQSLFSGR